ncbi:hypothetical protein [Desulfogranum mediterraneum]|uniref:hypothetical protein n=1 Tax=Desulfogranum mediterraneum TaxID=160661 RepID=UPI001294756E|nr:hypothetical protein [Desulfogranum mediterraneum]
MHQYASYKQFKQGLELLEKYIDGHPDEEGSLQGLNLLLKRINREKIKRWSQQNRLTDEKEVVEEENRGLLETVAGLEGQRELDQKRINELQKQIEQLKNIENIIKNREL